MARNLIGRIVVEGTLIALDPLHLGSGEESFSSDMSLAVNGSGQICASGTTITGALRAWCLRRFDPVLVDGTFGFQKSDSGHAAYLSVADGVVRSPSGGTMDSECVEIRDHVGIDDEYGSAATGIKFDRAILSPGSKIQLELTLELNADSEGGCDSATAQTMLGHLLGALQSPDGIRIGAAKTRGLGRVRLESDVQIVNESFGRAGLVSRLRRKQNSLTTTVALRNMAANVTPKKISRLRITIDWTPELPTMSKSGKDGLLVDTLPLLGATDNGLAPLLAGSGVKGIIRQRAELILRTLLKCYTPAWHRQTARTRFSQQLAEELPLIQELFGAKGSRNSKTGVGQGALSVADCFSKTICPAAEWDKLTNATPIAGAAHNQSQSFSEVEKMAGVKVGKTAVGREQWQVAFHNAIDRWTGGAADNMLFTVLEPHGEKWNPIVLELDVDRLGRDYRHDTSSEFNDAEIRRQRALVLLLLVLRDLSRQRIPLGFGGNRGLGEIAVQRIQFAAVEATPCGIDKEYVMHDGKLSAFGTLLDKWKSAWDTLFETGGQQ